jgi:SAM-dependent methyltransferase
MPNSGRHILAQFDDESVVDYQAYRPAIGLFAAKNGHFGGEFGLDRMSWIKPNSPAQLAQDRFVAEREGLGIETVQGDMANLSAFTDARFDLIVHPVSNVFVPDVKPVWREAYRVLKPGGTMLSGFTNPVCYLFDFPALERGEFRVAHRIPYSDVESLSDLERAKLAELDAPLEFGHTLDDQIGGQLIAGFVLTGFYEDIDPDTILGKHIPSYIATRALKPRS